MNRLCVLFFALFFGASFSIPLAAPEPESGSSQLNEVDGGALADQLREREGKIRLLPEEERTALRAAQQKALEDPAVKEALAKRDAAMAEFQQAFRDSMVKAEPEVAPILQKLAGGAGRGY